MNTNTRTIFGPEKLANEKWSCHVVDEFGVTLAVVEQNSPVRAYELADTICAALAIREWYSRMPNRMLWDTLKLEADNGE